ncbi:MAG: hypothetical protein Q8Q08_03480 [Candidatus Omnitrophota bacterium]|nr:hypothetical protein [Candidatus Omnitrophota bacterium]
MDADAEKTIREFLKSLRICVGNAAIYSEGHSVFNKSIEELHRKLNDVLSLYKSLEIFLAPRFLLINEKKLENDSLYEDLAKFFHRRSIKSIQFKQGTSPEELNRFILRSAQRPAEIIRQGGLDSILKNENLVRLVVEMLDYSQILKSVKEDLDIWAFLLRKAVDTENIEEVDSILDYFDHVVRDIGVKGFTEHEDVRKGMGDFLDYVKIKKNYEYLRCVKQLFKGILRNKEALKDAALPEDFTERIASLSAGDFAEILLDDLLEPTTSDLFILEVFARFGDKDLHSRIAESVLGKVASRASAQVTLEWIRKITGLLEKSGHPFVREVYAPVLSRLPEIFTGHAFHYDRELYGEHYRLALLNILAVEKQGEDARMIGDLLIEECGKAPEDRRLACLKALWEIIGQKRAEDPSLKPSLEPAARFVAGSVENLLLEEKLPPDFEFFLGALAGTVTDSRPYVETIFRKGRPGAQLLKAYFGFFPGEAHRFYENLGSKLPDMKFVLNLIREAKGLPPPILQEILKKAFQSPNIYVKMETLRMMQDLPACDPEFLLSVLTARTANAEMRELALRAMAKDGDSRKKAAAFLLEPLMKGRPDAAAEENLRLIGKLQIKEAADLLAALSRKKFANKNIETEVLQILRDWGHG